MLGFTCFFNILAPQGVINFLIVHRGSQNIAEEPSDIHDQFIPKTMVAPLDESLTCFK